MALYIVQRRGGRDTRHDPDPGARPVSHPFGVSLYPFALFAHLVFAMTLFGLAVAVDAGLVSVRRGRSELLPFVRRLLDSEALVALLTLAFGLLLLRVNPAGLALLDAGQWMKMKLVFGVGGPLLLLASRAGVPPAGPRPWVRGVRGLAQLLLVGAVFAATAMRLI